MEQEREPHLSVLREGLRKAAYMRATDQPSDLHLQWIYRGDDWLLVRRWEQLVAARDEVDVVQIISYNGAPVSPPLLSSRTLFLSH